MTGKKKPKPKIKYNMLEILQISCAVQRVRGSYIGTAFDDSNKKLVLNQLKPTTKDESYEVIDEDKETAKQCITHFQNLALKYLADTINAFEMSMYLIATSEEIEAAMVGFVALMPSRYQADTAIEPVSKVIRHANGPITCSMGDKIQVKCRVIDIDHVAKHCFWAILAITDENNAIRFNCSKDIFQVDTEYQISARVVSPSITEFKTQQLCTHLNHVKIIPS